MSFREALPFPAGTLLRRALRELGRACFEVLTPATCAACGVNCAGALCAGCAAVLELRGGPACPRCGELLLAPGSPCLAEHRFLSGIDALISPWRYRGAGGAIVRRFKFEGDLAAAALLVRATLAALRASPHAIPRRALVVHVPMHRQRRRQRGFDQAERLASSLARELDLRFVGAALRRCRATLSQTDPRVTSRTENVAGAFAVARARLLADATVLLVDDVITSGGTARACAGALRAAGVRRILLLTGAVG
jgi:ComF family protein